LGSRPFSTRDDSTNNWFVDLLTFGEGWHNNHHVHPTSARHGLKWYEIDMNWYGIWALKVIGLATQVTSVRAASLDRKEMAAGRHLTPASVRHLQIAAGD
jgi:stearoyl-CoA desaturase (delta-9 desaturase)